MRIKECSIHGAGEVRMWQGICSGSLGGSGRAKKQTTTQRHLWHICPNQ